MPTEIWRSRLGSGRDLELAVEVRQCPLRSGARSCDPRQEGGREKERKKEKATLIKSRDPQLAGGEK